MGLIDAADPAFRDALSAIEAGDVPSIQRIVAENPLLLTDRIDTGEGYFLHPCLLWFVAENPVRTEALPANIADVARAIIAAAVRLDVEGLPSQVEYGLGLVASGRVARECNVQDSLIDAFCEAGADPNGPLVAALAHRELGAVERLLACGASMTLFGAACLNLPDEIASLLPSSTAEERRGAFIGAALYGHADVLNALLGEGVDISAYAPNWVHPHATAVHHAVDSGRLDAVRLLVERGARLDMRDRVYDGTPLDWAEHLGRAEIALYLRSVASE